MKYAVPMVISEENSKEVFGFAEKNSILAKNLYNAALFRIRQVFFGWDKEHRSKNEQQVFDELNPHPIPKRTLQKNANRRK